jgi:hypothetical protein
MSERRPSLGSLGVLVILASTTWVGASSAAAQGPPYAEIRAAMERVVGPIRGCSEEPRHIAIDFTFAGSTGRVLEATVRPELPWDVAACVQGHATQAAVSPFARETWRVTYPFRLGRTFAPAAAPSADAPRAVPRGRRVAAELGLGFLVIAGASTAGALIGMAVAPDDTVCESWLCLDDTIYYAMGGAAIGTGAGYLLYPLTVAHVGGRRGGQGDVGAAYLGALVGGAANVGLGLLGLAAMDGGSEGLGLTLAFVGNLLALAGPVVAYELSHDAAQRPAVAPTVSLSDRGAVLGAAGRF